MLNGAIFDLDGVLTETDELHFQSWAALGRALGIPWDRAANEALRGLSREQSLEIFLGPRAASVSAAQKQELLARKNDDYLSRVQRLTPSAALPGARSLLEALRGAGWRVAVASSSRNAGLVLDRLELRPLLDAVVDGNAVRDSKPHPALFLAAAAALHVPAARCVVVEDAASGVAAGLAAGMRVIGIGPAQRVGGAHARYERVADVPLDCFASLLG